MNGKIKTTDMKVNWCVSLLSVPVWAVLLALTLMSAASCSLIQATLGCLPVQDFALNQDTQKIFRVVTRLSKCRHIAAPRRAPATDLHPWQGLLHNWCAIIHGERTLSFSPVAGLMEYQLQESSYRSLLSAVLLNKCLKARIWENSKHVAKQLDKIGGGSARPNKQL